MNRETLVCTCGREVGLVRLNAETVTFGHRSNPGLASHPVRLAPAARNGAIPVASTGQPEPAGREDAKAGSYPLTTRRHAGQSEGSAGSRVSPSRTSVTQLPVERASQPVVPLDGRTPRVPQVAGRRP